MNLRNIIVTAVEMLEPVILAVVFAAVTLAVLVAGYWIMTGPLGPVFIDFGIRVFNWMLTRQGSIITVAVCISAGVGFFSFLIALDKNRR